MSTTVFLAVLGAALLHAGWNALVKTGTDRFSAIVLLGIVQGGIAVVLLPFVPLPAPESLPWVLLGALLHTGYKLFLIRAYSHGDLSQIYPLARGTAPLIVSIVAAVSLGEIPGLQSWLAIGAVAGGIMMMSAGGGSGPRITGRALLWALGTAAFTASYTLADGVGVRLAGSTASFILWLFAADGLAMTTCALLVRGRGAVRAILPLWRSGLTGGLMSLGSYWIALWAFTQAPLALVAALRETSVLFAVLIAALFLKERVGALRWTAAALIAGGVVLMRA